MTPLSFSKVSLMLSLTLLVAAGCSSAIPLVPEDPDEPGTLIQSSDDIILLRGLWNVFSMGMDVIAEDLQQKGYKAGVFPGNNWKPLARLIIDRSEAGELGPTLVISGHSYGADDAIRLARALGEYGVQVDALVLVDPTFPPKIPPNVEVTVNIYRSKPSTDWMPWLRGVAVKGADPSTRIINRDLRDSPENAELLEEIDHFTIEQHPAIQQMVIDEILAIFNEAESRHASVGAVGQGSQNP